MKNENKVGVRESFPIGTEVVLVKRNFDDLPELGMIGVVQGYGYYGELFVEWADWTIGVIVEDSEVEKTGIFYQED